MIDQWSTYALADFVPYLAEVYFGLIAAANQTYWPLHVSTLTLGLVLIWLGCSRRPRLALGLLAAVWVWVAYSFLFTRYAELNWAAHWLGWGIVAQAGLLLLACIPFRRLDHSRMPATWPGITIALFGLLLYPLITAYLGSSWSAAEVFAIHPEPTAMASMGISLLALRGWRLVLTLFIPIAWCLLASLHLHVLEHAFPWMPIIVAATAILATIARPLARDYK